MYAHKCKRGKTYKIINIKTANEDITKHLKNIGFVKGNEITLVSILAGSFTFVALDARYSLDKRFLKLIEVEAA